MAADSAGYSVAFAPVLVVAVRIALFAPAAVEVVHIAVSASAAAEAVHIAVSAPAVAVRIGAFASAAAEAARIAVSAPAAAVAVHIAAPASVAVAPEHIVDYLSADLIARQQPLRWHVLPYQYIHHDYLNPELQCYDFYLQVYQTDHVRYNLPSLSSPLNKITIKDILQQKKLICK